MHTALHVKCLLLFNFNKSWADHFIQVVMSLNHIQQEDILTNVS